MASPQAPWLGCEGPTSSAFVGLRGGGEAGEPRVPGQPAGVGWGPPGDGTRPGAWAPRRKWTGSPWHWATTSLLPWHGGSCLSSLGQGGAGVPGRSP